MVTIKSKGGKKIDVPEKFIQTLYSAYKVGLTGNSIGICNSELDNWIKEVGLEGKELEVTGF